MRRHTLLTATTLCLALSLLAIEVNATMVMDLRPEQLALAGGDLEKSMTLNPNQRTLWRQVTAKARDVLRVRQSRREKLQADVKARLADDQSELRDVNSWIDVEADLSAKEDKQLRELWLTVNDALDDSQRSMLRQLLLDQLERASDAGQAPRGNRDEGAGNSTGRRRGGNKGGFGS
jgi:hypothetical protein